MSTVTTVPVAYTGGGAAKNSDGSNFGLVYTSPTATLNGVGSQYVSAIANSGSGAGITPLALTHTHSIPAIGLTGQSDSSGSYNELESSLVLIYKRTA